MNSNTELRCVTLNVRGLNDSVKRVKIIKWLEDVKSDIIFLQETYCTEKLMPHFNANWAGTIEHAITDSAHSRGVSILFHNKLNVQIENRHSSHDGRLLLLNVELQGKYMTLMNVYANNTEKGRKDLFKKIDKWIKQYAKYKDNMIIGGDMNCCLRVKDRTNVSHLNDRSRGILENILSTNNLKDAWSSVSNDPGYTFEDKRLNTSSRLDYIFVNQSVKLNPEDVYVSVCPCGPDHSAVFTKLYIHSNKRGPGYWKMNNELLNNDEFNANVERIVSKITKNQQNKSSVFVWETIKIEVKEMAIRLSIMNGQKRNAEKDILQKELDEVNKRLDAQYNVNELQIRKEELESKLDDVYKREARGAQLRSKAKYVENKETALKYFKNLEKVHQMNNVIECLQTESGDIVNSDDLILKECCKFYKELYSSQRIEDDCIESYVEKTEIPTLNNKDRELCDTDITEEEVYEAIRNLKNNKSPGIDGITPEFYKKHWQLIKLPFMNMLKESYDKNSLSTSLNQSVITLIFKKGDRGLLKNYRPISLSNYDYKIIAFVLARRLQKVIHNIVHPDQSAYIKGRYIGNNARYIADFYEYCEKHSTPGAILGLDFEKAYDRLEWNYMFRVLEAFNFGNRFIKWIQILYTNPVMFIKNNGWLSEPIEACRGIRQGCPASGMMFIIALELMAINIRTNNDIKGMQIGCRDRKLAQYADDSTLTLTDVESISVSMKTICDFCDVSGMKLNVHKTEGIWLGSFKDNPAYFCGINFTTRPVRILGIYIGHDVEGCYCENWLKKIQRLKSCIHVWKCRKLSLFGKVNVLKGLALAKFVYCMTVLPVPVEIIKEITKSFHSFLWKGTDRIKRNTLIAQYEHGGIKMVDVESMVVSLKAAWIPRLINVNKSENILHKYLHEYCLDIRFLLNGGICDDKLFPSDVYIPQFYKDCITSFNLCKSKVRIREATVHSFLTQPIWCNELFIFKGRSICYSSWIKSDIKWVKDLYDENGQFVTANQLCEKLLCKRNWISEYSIVKKSVERYGCLFDDKHYAEYENISDKIILNGKDRNFVIDGQKSKFFYNILVEKKCCRSYTERYWRKQLNKDIDIFQWEKIYMNRVHCLMDNRMRQFMYKLFHNIIPNREMLCKWKKTEDNVCPLCGDVENIKHIYYECCYIKPVWSELGKRMNIDLTWAKILIGYVENIPVHKIRNLLFSIVLYARYKLWVKSTEQSVSKKDFYNILVSDVYNWNHVIRLLDSNDITLMRNIWNKLEIVKFFINIKVS